MPPDDSNKFPVTAATDYHKLGGLKQQKFILSILEARSPKSRGQQRQAPSEGSRGESVPCLFQLLGVRHPLACGCITPISASVFMWLSPPFSVSVSLLSLIRTVVIGFRVHADNPG